MVIIVEISMVKQIKNDSYMTTTIFLFDNVTRKVESHGGFFYGVVIITSFLYWIYYILLATTVTTLVVVLKLFGNTDS